MLCSFPDAPGVLQERLVVIDVKDRAIFVGDPLQDEWQEFPRRVFLPLARVDLMGNTVKVHGNEKAGPSVDVLFNFKSDATVFKSAIDQACEEDNHKANSSVSTTSGAAEMKLERGLDVDMSVASVAPTRSPQPSMGPAPSQPSMPIKAVSFNRSPSPRELKPQRPAVAAQLGYASEEASERNSSESVGFSTPNSVDATLLRALEQKLASQPNKALVAAHRLSTTTVEQACKESGASDVLFIVDDDTMLDAVAASFEEQEHLLYIDKDGVECVISRSQFIARLVVTSVGYGRRSFKSWLTDSLSNHGLDTFPKLRSIPEDQGLGNALLMMMESGMPALGVVNRNDQIQGVLTYHQIIAQLSLDFKVERTLHERPSTGASTTKLPMRFVVSKDPYEGWGVLRTSAAVWVTSAVTEVSIIGLTFVDISASVVDQIYFNPCVSCQEDYAHIADYKGSAYSFESEEECLVALQLFDCDYAGTLGHPMNAFTGTILILFIAESLCRLYAFRASMFASILDVLDFCIVYASAGTFIWMVAAQGSKLVRKIVTVGRVMRFLRLIRMINKVRRAIFRDKQVGVDGHDLDLLHAKHFNLDY